MSVFKDPLAKGILLTTPITGPFNRVQRVSVNRAGSYYKSTTGYRQKRPYNLPTAYTTVIRGMYDVFYFGDGYLVNNDPSTDTWANVNNGRSPVQMAPYLYDMSDPTAAALIARCREKFSGKIGDTAELLTCLAESRKTLDALADKLMTGVNFFRNVRRGNFQRAAGVLGLKHPRAADPAYIRRWRAKSFADKSLEFAFGWAPLYADVSNALDFLSRPFPYEHIKARKSFVTRWMYGPNHVGQSTGWSTTWARHYVEMSCEIGAYVEVSNPNLYLSSQLGINNLAGTAWEIVPWSFVVDYWFNVSQFLSQWTEYSGLSFKDAYHTLKARDTVSSSFQWHRYGHITDPSVKEYYERSYQETGLRVERKLGIPTVTLGWKLPWRLSAFRAWTSISLLLQQGFKSYR